MKLVMIVLAGILVVVGVGEGKTIQVPGDYNTIQGAIDASVNGDTVLVHPGTYIENINFKGKAVTVISSDGANVTAIDGNQAYRVVEFNHSESTDSIIEGFTITNGQYLLGGGIHCNSSSPSILNNIIENNVAEGNGGGIYCSDSNALISNNIIMDNTAWGMGGGIRCLSSSPTILNNIICGNSSEQYGGGIYCLSANPVITNCTIFGNNAIVGGGGIGCRGESYPIISNTIIWDNIAPLGPEICLVYYLGSSVVTIDYSDVKGGQSLVHLDPNCSLTWGLGMIDLDPLFINPINNKFQLQQDSCQPGIVNPCVDSGDPGASMIDGTTRTDSLQDAGIVDMGYHYPIIFAFLNADTYTLSESTGGTVQFYLTAGTANAKRTYILLGSLSGTEPGQGLPGGHVTLPLNWDLFTDLIVAYMNSSFFMNFLGILDPGGDGIAILNTFGPLPTGMAGTTMSFAYALNMPWDFVSNPVNIEVIP